MTARKAGAVNRANDSPYALAFLMRKRVTYLRVTGAVVVVTRVRRSNVGLGGLQPLGDGPVRITFSPCQRHNEVQGENSSGIGRCCRVGVIGMCGAADGRAFPIAFALH